MTPLCLAIPLIGALACLPALAETGRAAGKFDITVTPAAPPIHEGRTAMARMLLDKQYSGELLAAGKGEMLTARTDTKGSAAYVAMERITGTLSGRKGSFVVHHAGVMSGGANQLTVSIVPDSGTEELAGISGHMSLEQIERQHYYELEYVLPAKQ